MTKFFHISDLHYHKSQDDNISANVLLALINSRYPDHHLIITGDITDDGRPIQYLNALEALTPFKNRSYLTPGNHDFGLVGNFYTYDCADNFDQILSIPLNQGGTFYGDNRIVVNYTEDTMLIALDSNLETTSPFDFACGEIGTKQLDELNHILDIPNNKTKILFFHHHPFIHNNPFMYLKDASDLARIVYGRVDVILFGHKHEAATWENRWNIKYINASDNSPGKHFITEITVKDGVTSLAHISI